VRVEERKGGKNTVGNNFRLRKSTEERSAMGEGEFRQSHRGPSQSQILDRREKGKRGVAGRKNPQGIGLGGRKKELPGGRLCT